MIYFIIWLVGALLNYPVGKFFWRKDIKFWGVADRRFVLFTCIFSWVGMLAHFIRYVFSSEDFKTPASW